MKKLFFAAVVALIATTSLQAQKTIQGKVVYAYEIEGENAEMMAAYMPTSMEFGFGKNSMFFKLNGGMMASMMGKIIGNGETGEVFMLKDADKIVYLMRDEEIAAANEKSEEPEVEATGETKEVYGYKCKKYVMKNTDPQGPAETILWVSPDLKAPEYKDSKIMGAVGQNYMSDKIDGFPLQMEMEMTQPPIKIILTVTNIDFKKISDKEFERPDDYEVKDFSEIGMGM